MAISKTEANIIFATSGAVVFKSTDGGLLLLHQIQVYLTKLSQA